MTWEDIRLLEILGGAIAPVLNARLERDRREAERKEAEEALRGRKTTHRTLSAQWRTCSSSWRRMAELATVNEATCQSLGYSEEN